MSKPDTVIVLTETQNGTLKRREIHETLEGPRLDFVEKHLNYSRFAKRINLKKLSSEEVQAFHEILMAYCNARSYSKRYAVTRRSLRKKAEKVAAFMERSAVDRLGDVSR